MRKLYFSGFCLQNEKKIFDEYLEENDFIVSGFSYGAIKAFNHTLELINNNKRVDKLQLFSPAYFNDKDKKYKRMQLMYFKKDKKSYIENFLKNAIYPTELSLEEYFKEGSFDQLDELINYFWDEKKLILLNEKNVKIEVFLGENDKIIDANKAKDFFKQYATVYFVKSTGHTLM